MTRAPGPFARTRARLRGDERGFSLLETVIAIGVIFSSLVVLAFTATVGFGYQGLARQRQAATGIANEVMEQIRGLAYEKIQAGLLSTDLAGDPNIVGCSGTYRFLSCTPDPGVPGSGEKIVSSPGLATTVPLVPHRSSTAPNTNPVRDGTTYQWATYVTRNDSVATAPYRVTVIVTWSGGAVNIPTKLVRVQSLIWSPIGCRSTQTHPFAAPCQPFFYGTTTVPQSNVTVAGTVDQLTFTSGQLLTPRVTSSGQQEQVEQVQGSWDAPEAVVTDGGGTRTAGGTTQSTNADSDPATSTPVYSRVRCPTDVACASGTVSSTAAGNTISFSAGSGTTAESDSTTEAGGANVCPPPTDPAEADALLCGGGRIQQGGTLSSVLSLTNGVNPGDISVVRIQAPSSASKTLVNRTAYPSTAGCSPTSTTDGCVALSVSRSIGTLNIGGLPSGFTAPTGWSGGNAWNGYFLSLVGYQDSLTGSAGTDSPLPTGSLSGTVYYYNGSGYSSVSVTNAALNGLNVSHTETQTVGGDEVTVTISTDAAGMAAGTTSLSPTTPSGNATRTQVDAQVIPPSITVRYTVSKGGTTLADLTITVTLGTIEARGTYAPAPAGGS